MFVDLRSSPLANSFVEPAQLHEAELYYPLTVYICLECLLVQLPVIKSPAAIFSEYAYFSSFSTSWLAHARRYVEEISERLSLDSSSQVIEIASNDGYLLQYFQQRGVPVLGIDPAANVAEAAIAKGVPTRVEFFDSDYARRLVEDGLQADLIVGNNVLAHVDELTDFVNGLAIALKPGGVVTMEFPHLQRLIEESQFDTIYHEHFSYFSFGVTRRVFADQGLRIFDVEQLSTHGGSLRIYACRDEDPRPMEPAVEQLLAQEREAGLDRLEGHLGFDEKVRETKRKLLEFLIEARRAGRSVVGYGAAAKGNALLNYCGVGTDLIDYVVDGSPHKQGRFLPGSRIPIHEPERIAETRPDYVLILPWNLKDEIVAQMSEIREWGGRFCVAVPELTVL